MGVHLNHSWYCNPWSKINPGTEQRLSERDPKFLLRFSLALGDLDLDLDLTGYLSDFTNLRCFKGKRRLCWIGLTQEK